jgi:WD40 repeat protein
MKAAAILLPVLAALVADVTPRSSNFHPKRLVEERSFAAPGLWLVAPGGKFIATATGGDSVGLIDVATGRDLGVLGDHDNGGRHDGNFGQSDHILATTANDGTVKVWDAATRKEIATFKDPFPHAGYT